MSVSTEITIGCLHEIRQNECIEFHCGLADFTSIMKTGVRLLGAMIFC